MYIMDLLLGEEPWLNLTTACTFPEPWMPLRVRSRKVHSEFSRSTDYEKYAGIYGNFVYGNITFKANSSALVLEYGQMGRWQMVPVGTDSFRGVGIGTIWFDSLDSITFSKEGDFYTTVDIDFDPNVPTMFTRGLSMSEAPSPPDPARCDDKPLPGSAYKHLSHISLAAVLCIMFNN